MTALSIAARSRVLASALAKQSFTDWILTDESSAAAESLGIFRSHPARYLLVSLSDEDLAAGLSTRGQLLYWLVRMETDQLGLMLLVDESGAVAGFLVALRDFLDHSRIPARRDFVSDLVQHATEIGVHVGSLVVLQRAEKGVVPIIVESAEVRGWREGPIGLTPEDRERAADAATRPPPSDATLVSCGTNELYGHGSILRAYCRMREMLPIVGRVQHGWAPGPFVLEGGPPVVAEEPMRFGEVKRYYVWGETLHDRLLESGEMQNGAKAFLIGAPYLYLPQVVDHGPVSNCLLAVPGHGINRNPLAPWIEGYVADLRQAANVQGFAGITVLLYGKDNTPEMQARLREAGIRSATCGDPADPAYLKRLRGIIRQHVAVTSDRLCTATFYALYEGRPFFLAGCGRVRTVPPDRYEGVVTDPKWIAAEFPGVFAGGLEGCKEAARELGVAHIRQPGELRCLLYSWVYGE